MPIEIKLADAGAGLVQIATGTLSGAQILSAVEERFESESSVARYKYCLLDYSETQNINISTEEIITAASVYALAAKKNPDMVVAIVASEDIIYGLARMWESYAKDIPWEKMVFRNREEAEKWIRETVKAKFDLDVSFR